MTASYKEESVSNIGVASDAYIYSTISIDPPHRFLAIASDDSLCSFNALDATIELITRRQGQHQGITCICKYVNPDTKRQVYVTAGRDGKIRAFTWPEHNKLWEISVPNGKPISALTTTDSQPCPFLAAGTEHEAEGLGEVGVYVWALNTAGSPTLLRSFTESHTDTVTCLEFATVPTPRQIAAVDSEGDVRHDANGVPTVFTTIVARLLSASTDGLVNYFTLEKPLEDDSVLVTFNNRSAVHHACLVSNKNDDGIVAVISHDERIAYYSISETDYLLEGETKPGPWDLRSMLGCDYAISLRACNADSTVVVEVGANKPETTDVPWVGAYTCRVGPELLKSPPEPQLDGQVWMKLEGAHGEEVVRGMWYDWQKEGKASMVLTCGEDAQVKMWKRSDGASGLSVSPAQKEKGRKAKSGKREKGHRFEPY